MNVEELKRRQHVPEQQTEVLQIVPVGSQTIVKYDPIWNKRVFRMTPNEAHLGAVGE